MNHLDPREWLLTNGLGSFASGTVCDAPTRTYHGWLIAALDPPSQRTLLLSHLAANLSIEGQDFELGTTFWADGAIAPTGYQFLQSFQVEPVPTWVWGQTRWQLSRRLIMPYGLQADRQSGQPLQFCNRILVHYRYEGQTAAVLRLKPIVGDRIFHYQQNSANLEFAQSVQVNCLRLQAKRSGWVGTSWQLRWTAGEFYTDRVWHWGYRYPEETKRGLADQEDLYCPGTLVVLLHPGDCITLEAKVKDSLDETLQEQTFDRAIQAEQNRLAQAFSASCTVKSAIACPSIDSLPAALLKAGDQFVVYRASTQSPTVIAGYPWFNDWGRDTLIALPGLALTTRRYELAKGLLQTFGQHCQEGLIPNAFPDAGAKPFYNSLDASLWWIETLGLYLEATEDWAFLRSQYPIVWRIYKRLMAGTLYSIRVDAFDGLVTWDAPNLALTWMDAIVAGEPVTPRRGKAVEINALWYSALRWAESWAMRLYQESEGSEPGAIDTALLSSQALHNQAKRFREQAEQVQASLQKFWNPAQSYLYDTIAPDDTPDPSIRPNAVIALSLKHCGFSVTVSQQVLQVARDRLLTPYGLRSLDPADPNYIGRYTGGIWQRDRAYHQGTVWTWLLGVFIRSWQRFYPDKALSFDWQPLLDHFATQACLGSVSELFDGDSPHLPQGAIAQAWSVAELIRVGAIGAFGAARLDSAKIEE
jgi:predicted glycogen debranching enzyme